MLKTKEQLREQSKEKLINQLQEVKVDMQALGADLKAIADKKSEIVEVAPEVYNVLYGIQRDLRFGKDRIKSISINLFKEQK